MSVSPEHCLRPVNDATPIHPSAILLCIVAASSPSACSLHEVDPDRPPPLVSPLPERFVEGGIIETPFERWWKSFADPQLDRLVDEVLAGNLDLARAWARVAQAEAIARGADAALFPKLNAQAGVSGSRTVFDLGEPIGVRSNETTSFSLGVSASYELDLWGRVAHASDAAASDVLATREDMAAMALSLAARITDVWLQRAGERALLELVTRQEAASQRLVELVEQRFATGLATSLEVYQQRQQLAVVRAQRPLVEARLAVLAHQLAILTGRPPGALTFTEAPFLPLPPPPPPTGVPADLLQRRPDVRAAFLRVLAADHRVGQAIAAQYPTLGLSASTGFQSPDLLELFERWVWSLVANLVAPLFDGGQRSAEVDRARAQLEELVAAYGQALLTALGEVEDALVQEHRQRDHLALVEEQLALARSAHAEARTRYVNGLGTYLEVLTTERSEQQAEQALLQARRQMLAYRVQLHRALGGTWARSLRPTSAPDTKGSR